MVRVLGARVVAIGTADAGAPLLSSAPDVGEVLHEIDRQRRHRRNWMPGSFPAPSLAPDPEERAATSNVDCAV